ncbi:hypothetical protein PCANC_04137 [Puccinia coronata f. sp. avenae]|uniref:Reverse transcriptase Ty1/copia-type domain-containing protein n=1 Tax=Puccinia coronata f. sp. avenae TaxID=200324 RepID=A0A2N5W776_9BASI|nr:hypothetical protein PCANC_04137 [Puccinia coronata f. sp. avenae]
MVTQQMLWVQQLIEDVLAHQFKGQLICDNEAAIKVGKDDSSNKRTRHTERDFYITNQALFEGKATLIWVATDDQIAEILTKALAPEKHGLLAIRVQVNNRLICLVNRGECWDIGSHLSSCVVSPRCVLTLRGWKAQVCTWEPVAVAAAGSLGAGTSSEAFNEDQPSTDQTPAHVEDEDQNQLDESNEEFERQLTARPEPKIPLPASEEEDAPHIPGGLPSSQPGYDVVLQPVNQKAPEDILLATDELNILTSKHFQGTKVLLQSNESS